MPQDTTDWSIVCAAIADAADVDGLTPAALAASFAHHGLRVAHADQPPPPDQPPPDRMLATALSTLDAAMADAEKELPHD